MILSDTTILNEIKKGSISIYPFYRDQLGCNTYDLRIGDRLARYENSILDARKYNAIEKFEIEEEGYMLKPDVLYLASTYETVEVKNDICATLMGKSSLARLGLDIHICGGFIDSGFKGNIVLEIRVIHHLVIYPKMKIAQLKFERIEGDIEMPYDKNPNSKYNNQKGIVESRMYLNNFNI